MKRIVPNLVKFILVKYPIKANIRKTRAVIKKIKIIEDILKVRKMDEKVNPDKNEYNKNPNIAPFLLIFKILADSTITVTISAI